MTAFLALLIFVAGLAAYTVATFYIVRWMFVAQLRNVVETMDTFYMPRFIDGIRYASHIVAGTSCPPAPRAREQA